MKLSKQDQKLHEEALAILEKDTINFDDREFVFKHYNEAATHMIGKNAAFFTPMDLARDFAIEACSNGRIIDLCAGIGHLTYAIIRQKEFSCKDYDITCIELNPEYYEIGKKLLPKVNWILGDVTDKDLIDSLGTFDLAISNPPYGRIKTGSQTFPFKSKSDFEFKVVEIGTYMANYGVYLLPQGSTPFLYSGTKETYGANAIEGRSAKYDKFTKDTGIAFTFNCGIGTEYAKWRNTNIVTEIVCVEKEEEWEDQDIKEDLLYQDSTQGTLF